MLWPDITLSGDASSPKDADMVKLKGVDKFCSDDRPFGLTTGVRSDHIMANTNSEWAANLEDRRSMSECLSTTADS